MKTISQFDLLALILLENVFFNLIISNNLLISASNTKIKNKNCFNENIYLQSPLCAQEMSVQKRKTSKVRNMKQTKNFP